MDRFQKNNQTTKSNSHFSSKVKKYALILLATTALYSSDASASSEIIQTLTTDVLFEVPSISGDATVLCSGDYTITGDSNNRTAPWEQVSGTLTLGTPLSLGENNPLILGNGAKFHMNNENAFANAIKFRAGTLETPSTQYIGNEGGSLTLAGHWAEIANDDARTGDIYTPGKVAIITFEGAGTTILKSILQRTHNGSFIVKEGTLSFEDTHETASSISNVEVLANAIARLKTATGLSSSSKISLHNAATFDIKASPSSLPSILYKTLVVNSVSQSAAPLMTISANATFTNSIADEDSAYPASVTMTGTKGDWVVFNSDNYTASGSIVADKLKFDIQKTIIADSQQFPTLEVKDNSNTELAYLKLSCAKPLANTKAYIVLQNANMGLNYADMNLANDVYFDTALTVDVSANATLSGTWKHPMLGSSNLSLLSDTSNIRTITLTNNVEADTFTTRDIRFLLNGSAELHANEIHVTTSEDYRASVANQEDTDYDTAPALVLSATTNPLPSDKSIYFDEGAYLIVQGANYTINNPLIYTSANDTTALLFNAATTFTGPISVVKSQENNALQKFFILPGNLQVSTVNLGSTFTGVDELYLLQSNYNLQDGVSLPSVVSIGSSTLTVSNQEQLSGVNLFALDKDTIITTGMSSLSNNIGMGDDFILQSDVDFEYTGSISNLGDNLNKKVTFENTAEERKNITISGEQNYTGPTEFKNALVTVGNTMQTSAIEIDSGSELTLAGTAKFPKISQLEIGDGAKLILDLASSDTNIAIGNSSAELTITQTCEYSGTISGDFDFRIKFQDNQTGLTLTETSKLEHKGFTLINNGGTITFNSPFALESENLTRTNSAASTIFGVTPFIAGNAIISVPVGSTIGVNTHNVIMPEIVFTAFEDYTIAFLDTLVESTLFKGNITTLEQTSLRLQQSAAVDLHPNYYFNIQGVISTTELHMYASTLLGAALKTPYVYVDSNLKLHVSSDTLFDNTMINPWVEFSDNVIIKVPSRVDKDLTTLNGNFMAKDNAETLNLICEMSTDIDGAISGTNVNITPTSNATVTLKKANTFTGTLTLGDESNIEGFSTGNVVITDSLSASSLVLKKSDVKLISSAPTLFSENAIDPSITVEEASTISFSGTTVNATVNTTAGDTTLIITDSVTFTKTVDASGKDITLNTTFGGGAVFNGALNAQLLTINNSISTTLNYAGTSDVSVFVDGAQAQLSIGKDQSFTENNSLRCNNGEILIYQKSLNMGITNGEGNVTITAAAAQADGYDAAALSADLDLLSGNNNATEALKIASNFGLSQAATLNLHGAYSHNLIELATGYNFENPIRVLANVSPEHVVTTSNTLAITNSLASKNITVVQGSGVYVKGNDLLTDATTITFEADSDGAVISNFRFDGTVLNAKLAVPTNANVMATVLTDTTLAGTLSGDGVIQFKTTLTDLEEIRSIELGDASNFAGTIILSGGTYELKLNQINSNLKIVCADENTSFVITYNDLNNDTTAIFQDPIDMVNGALKDLLLA